MSKAIEKIKESISSLLNAHSVFTKWDFIKKSIELQQEALALLESKPEQTEFTKVKLTQGKMAMVSNLDFDRVNALKWNARKDTKNGRWYAERANGVKMHRFILGLKMGDGTVVDHINGDGLDNRRENIRICSQSQNNRNRLPNKNSTSRFKGVSFKTEKGKWQAQISIEHKGIFIGYYDTEVEAAKAYDNAARKYHKEFAYLNFPQNALEKNR